MLNVLNLFYLIHKAFNLDILKCKKYANAYLPKCLNIALNHFSGTDHLEIRTKSEFQNFRN